MNTFFSYWNREDYLSLSRKKTSVENLKRQKFLLTGLFSHYSPKHYPRIFLDQRLKSRFFR